VKVHQVLAALSYGDAIGNEALAIQKALRAAGHESEVVAELVHPRVAHLARPLHEYRQVSAPDTVCVFHFSIGSAAGRLVHHAPDRLVVVYHNITPAHFFLGFHPHLAGLCHHGRRELAAFAPRSELALGDSEFNRRELAEAGFARTAVLPIVLDLPLYERPASPVVRRMYDDGRTNVLFVGRIIPNKRIDDLVRSFAFFQRFVRPHSRLLLVGDHRGFERYLGRLQELVRETLGGGGLLLREKRPELVAELLGRLTHGGELRRTVLAAQKRAVDAIRATDFGALVRGRLRPVLEAPARPAP
jgi:glycosyltransferase involved in cell wall biosynthesis